MRQCWQLCLIRLRLTVTSCADADARVHFYRGVRLAGTLQHLRVGDSWHDVLGFCLKTAQATPREQQRGVEHQEGCMCCLEEGTLCARECACAQSWGEAHTVCCVLRVSACAVSRHEAHRVIVVGEPRGFGV